MNNSKRGRKWFDLLTKGAPKEEGLVPSVECVKTPQAVYIAVVPDENNHYPRARGGEVGLLEGWTLGKVLRSVIEEDREKTVKRPIIAVVDVTSQAYGRREEAFGIHQALASSASGYAMARMAGHPVIAFIVAKAMSGAFLAHGYQANRLIALDDEKVLIHAMGKQAAARITLRSVEDLDKFAATVPPMAYDIKNYATLGLLEELVKVENADEPTAEDVRKIEDCITQAVESARKAPVDLRNRLGSVNRSASSLVREKMKQQWKE